MRSSFGREFEVLYDVFTNVNLNRDIHFNEAEMSNFVEDRPEASSSRPYQLPGKAVAAPLAPLLAGARARGVADGLEWLGLAAVLLDDRGEVLHVNCGAVELMGERLYLQSGRLRATDPHADRALEAAIRQTLAGGSPSRLAIPSVAAPGQEELYLRIAVMDNADDDPFQLLRAVAILESAGQRPVKRDHSRH